MNFTTFNRFIDSRVSLIHPDFRKQLCEVPLVGLSSFWPLRWSWKEKLPDKERIVLFVHGYGGFPSHFRPMRSYFHWMGRKHTFAMTFSNFTSIQTMASELQNTIRMICAFHNREYPVIELVCHSMGGIIARLALEDPATSQQVATLITLATPHHGTQLARYVGNERINALSPQSSTLARLAKQIPWKEGVLPPLISFWTAKDLVLLPPESGVVSGAKNIECQDFSHLSFMVHPKSWQLVYSALDS
jgi:triacylglycerol lipase